MGSKPKAQNYKPTEADKANAAVAVAEYNFFKQNYDPLLRNMRDEALSDDAQQTLRARANADTMQALTGETSLAGAQRVDAAPAMAQAIQGQLGQATAAGQQIQNQMASNVLGVARKQGADAQTGMATASRLATSEALARAKAQQDVANAKLAAGTQLAGTVIGSGFANMRTTGVDVDPATGKLVQTQGSFFKPATTSPRAFDLITNPRSRTQTQGPAQDNLVEGTTMLAGPFKQIQALMAMQQGGSVGGLPVVSDPDKAYANITRQEYMDMVNNYRDFELGLINQAQTDTSLIDQAREDSAKAAELTAGIQQRNLERYGGSLTGQQTRQMDRALQRGSTLGGIQAMNDARIAQNEANTRLLADLINIGQGVNRASQSQLAQSAVNATNLKNAYQQAKAQSKAQTYSTVASLGSAAIMGIMMGSDRRIKHDIKQVDVSPNGTNIYEFKYVGAEGTYRGVMADEVPWAVEEGPSGYQMVDYSKVDVDFVRVG